MSGGTHRVRLLRRARVAEHTLELVLSKPKGFLFAPGQSIRIVEPGAERDYSIASGPLDPCLVILVRLVERGVLTPILASAPLERTFLIEGPRGYFTCAPTTLPLVFAATGTGAAPFLSMARAGLSGFTMLHGVRQVGDMLYPGELRAAAALFVPCVSRGPAGDSFSGRVTEWVKQRLAPRRYDFYLCGRQEMIGDMTVLVDDRFPGSRVHTEIFF